MFISETSANDTSNVLMSEVVSISAHVSMPTMKAPIFTEPLTLKAITPEQNMEGGEKVGEEEKWIDLYDWDNYMSPWDRGGGNNVQNLNPINGVLGKIPGKISSMTNCTINFIIKSLRSVPGLDQ